MTYKNTRIWQKAFESNPKKTSHPEARRRLASAFERFRDRADELSREIPADVRQLTDHSIHHLDALWEMADIIAGDSIELNPVEAFVFGGAVLLHDLANTVAAFPNGLKDLYGDEWNDLVHAAYIKTYARRPTPEECLKPDEALYPDILLKHLRKAHARQAQELATDGFYRRDSSGERIYLLDDDGLRNDLGRLIGRIAHSHHQSIHQVVKEFRNHSGTSPALPRDWSIDALTIACLLRAADAAHLDRRRAPVLTHAVRKLPAESEKHWKFQSLMQRAEVQHEQLKFTSSRPFTVEERESWWLCYETLKMVDAELRGIDEAFRNEFKRRFAAKSVAGTGSPEDFASLINTKGWVPVDARVRITDVAGVIERFGGTNLYGDNPLFPLRELIANAADAIRARRELPPKPAVNWGRITVRLGQDDQQWWLEVEDEGIGMSESVLRGPLLDFGTSYWRSELARSEHPGLLSSNFEPTGRFGIGFFAVFMLGNRVRVTTVPHEGGRASGRVLEISQGDGSHPFIRPLQASRSAENSPVSGTRVRVWLKAAPHEELLREFIRGRHDEEPPEPRTLLEALVRATGHVVPTLDVAIDCAVGTEDAHRRSALEANDWETLPFDELLSRLEGKVGHFKKHSATLGTSGEIRREGRLIARLQLGIPGRADSQCHFTIRGLSTLNPEGTFQGLLIADGPNLSRTTAQPLARPDEIGSFVEANLPSPKEWSHVDWYTRLSLAELLVRLKLEPNQIPCFLLKNKFVTLQEVGSWLSSIPQESPYGSPLKGDSSSPIRIFAVKSTHSKSSILSSSGGNLKTSLQSEIRYMTMN